MGILVGEMWLGVCAAIVVELSPNHLTASCVGLYFFIIQIIGGNMNLFVTPITHNLNLRLALLITFPGFYIVGGIGFAITLALHMSLRKTDHDDVDRKTAAADVDVKKPLTLEIVVKPEADAPSSATEVFLPKSDDTTANEI